MEKNSPQDPLYLHVIKDLLSDLNAMAKEDHSYKLWMGSTAYTFKQLKEEIINRTEAGESYVMAYVDGLKMSLPNRE